MIPPRRSDTGTDAGLVTGLLGASALLAEVDAVLRELAEDGAQHGAGDEPADHELVDVALGLAALSMLIAQRVPADRGSAAALDQAEPSLRSIDLVVGELLR